MNYEPVSSGSPGKTLPPNVFRRSVVIVAIIIACSGLGYFVYDRFVEGVRKSKQRMADMKKSEPVAQSFINDLVAGRIESAYERTSQGFQSRQTLKEFQDLVENRSFLQKKPVRKVDVLNQAPTQTTFTVSFNGSEGLVTCVVQLLKEDGQWKIDRFTVP